MATQNDTRAGTFLVETAITAAHLTVTIGADGIGPGAATGNIIGTSIAPSEAGDYATVEYLDKEGSKIYISAGAIAIGNYVVAAADGEVTGSGTAPAGVDGLLGVAVSAAGGAGEQVEVVNARTA